PRRRAVPLAAPRADVLVPPHPGPGGGPQTPAHAAAARPQPSPHRAADDRGPAAPRGPQDARERGRGLHPRPRHPPAHHLTAHTSPLLTPEVAPTVTQGSGQALAEGRMCYLGGEGDGPPPAPRPLPPLHPVFLPR